MKSSISRILWSSRSKLAALTLSAALLCGCSTDPWTEIIPDPVFSAPVFVTPDITEAPARQGDGVLTLNYAADFSMNPFITQSEANLQLSWLLFEPMVRVTPGFHAEPGVFSSWTEEAGVVFRFTVQEGLYFSDGSEVRSWDVLYSLNRAREEGSHYRSRLSDIAESFLEGSNIVIRLKEPNPCFPLRLDIPVVKEGSAYSELPIGSGPYILTQDKTGNVLKANTAYRGSAEFPLQSISLCSLPQEQLNAAFSDGSLDILIAHTGADVAFMVPGDAERRYLETSILHFLCVSPDSKALAAPERRRLVNAALNRNSIAALIGGSASYLPISQSTGYVSSSWIDESIPKDLEAFKIEILTEDYNGDGILEYFVGGEPRDLELKLLYCSDSSSNILAANRIITDLQGIGITMIPMPMEMDEYRRTMRNGGYDLCLASVRLSSDFDLSSLLCSGGNLYVGGCSGELQQAVKDYKSAEPDDRAAYAQALCGILAQECPILPLCFSRTILVMGRGVARGLEPTWTDPYRKPMNWVPGNI